jgi:hypothetical protein
MMRLKSKLLVGLFATFALLSFVIVPVHAQSILYGKLTGTVTDETKEPLPGVTVEITSDALIGGARSDITPANGRYAFLSLPVGKYKLTATLQGFKTAIQENIIINADSVRVVDIILTPGAIEEQITVTAAAPIVDARSSTTSTSIDSKMIDKMPTSRDAFYDLALSAPGMQNHGNPGATGWMPSPTAYGGATNENVFLLNGVNATSPQAGSFGSLLRVNYNAVEEVRLIALGSKAEYGSFSGVAVDVLTKSGGSEFHGNFAVYSNLGKGANNQPDATKLGKIGEANLYISPDPHTGQPEAIATRTTRNLEGTFSLGGPIIKDKLWFYADANYVDTKTDTPIWPKDETFKGFLGDIKLTAAPWTNHRAWIAYHVERNSAGNGTWDRTWDPEVNYGQDTTNNSISAQWQWMPTGKTIVTAKYLGFWSTPYQTIPAEAPEWPAYINWWKWYRYGVNGCFPNLYRGIAKRNTLQADVSHYVENFLGEHDIKFGVQLTKGSLNAINGYFRGYSNGAYPQRWCGPNVNYMVNWYGDTGLKMYVRQTHQSPYSVVRTSDAAGLFFDDQWTPTRRLTVNLGLRYDVMTSKYGKGEVYKMPSTPAGLNESMTVVRDTKGSTNIFDFKTLGPRIGITYALTSDMKTIFRASYGRYYLPLAAEYLKGSGPDAPIQDRQWLYYTVPWSIADANGDRFVDMFEAINSARALHGLTPDSSYWDTYDVSWKLNVAPGVKDQYTDQFTLNLERELFSDFSAGLTYIYKSSKNEYLYWPINKFTGKDWEYTRIPWTTSYGYSMNLYSIVLQDFNGDGKIDQGDVNWIWNSGADGYEVRNLPKLDGIKPHRSYNGLQFVLRKRYSNRWQMLGSFLYSTSDGVGRRSIRTDVNVEGPMIMNDYFLHDINEIVNNLEGPLPFTSKYEFKLSGSYLIPGIEADLGYRFRWNSGRPFWPVQVFPTNSPWAPVDPNKSTINNSTFAQTVAIDVTKPWYYPSEAILDLRLSRDFKIGGSKSLNVALDLLNVFNENVASYIGEGSLQPVGRVTSVTIPSRMFRLSVRFDF